MNRIMNPEFLIIALVAIIAAGYLFALMQKKKPRKKPRNPYRRGNERNDKP